jgi:hypothetical protein
MDNFAIFEIEDGYDLHTQAIAVTSQYINKRSTCQGRA